MDEGKDRTDVRSQDICPIRNRDKRRVLRPSMTQGAPERQSRPEAGGFVGESLCERESLWVRGV